MDQAWAGAVAGTRRRRSLCAARMNWGKSWECLEVTHSLQLQVGSRDWVAEWNQNWWNHVESGDYTLLWNPIFATILESSAYQSDQNYGYLYIYIGLSSPTLGGGIGWAYSRALDHCTLPMRGIHSCRSSDLLIRPSIVACALRSHKPSLNRRCEFCVAHTASQILW